MMYYSKRINQAVNILRAGARKSNFVSYCERKYRYQKQCLPLRLKREASFSSTKRPQTPMMQQYWNAKSQYPEFVLLFRMGDFFEVFYEDAKLVSSVLRITLTRRVQKNRGKEEVVPMCGIPHFSLQKHLERLVKQGISVAICDQIQRNDKAINKTKQKLLQREVVQLITPGTLVEENLLQPNEHNYLVSLVAEKKVGDIPEFGLAQLDLSTGELSVNCTSASTLSHDISRLSPAELLVSEEVLPLLPKKFKIEPPCISIEKLLGVSCPVKLINKALSSKELGNVRFNGGHDGRNVLSMDSFEALELASLRVLLYYVQFTQRGRLPTISYPSRLDFTKGSSLQLDKAAIKALEIFQTTGGESEGSLFSAIDRTRTSAGARLLKDRINFPLTCPEQINHRLDAVSFFRDSKVARLNAKTRLSNCEDLHRCIQRVHVGRCSPRDLWAIAVTLKESKTLAEEIAEIAKDQILISDAGQSSFGEITTAIENIIGAVDERANDFIHEILSALVSSPTAIKDSLVIIPSSISEGGVIVKGYCKRLDEVRELASNRQQKLKQLESKYQHEYALKGLRIKSNNRLGYFVEISNKNSAKLTPDVFFYCNQTSSVSRYKTEALADLETKLRYADWEALEIETAIFDRLCDKALRLSNRIVIIAEAIAKIDVSLSLGELAVEKGLCRPKVDRSEVLQIIRGRHLVVEAMGSFVPNNLMLDEHQRSWLITGPNMGGKSTFLRQSAHIVILAQAGSFVPAESTRIGVVDTLFCRVGASDELQADRSTFMIEMEETAHFLLKSTGKSFVIVDELGRGTSPEEGIAIAQAVLEDLLRRKCRTLFATHFHELAHRIHDLDCRTYAMAIAREQDDEKNDRLTFLYSLQPGVCSESCGLYVAGLAGIPEEVLKRASQLLTLSSPS